MSGGAIQMELGFGFGEWREGAGGGRVLGFWGLLFLWNGLGPIISCANNALGGKFWEKTKLNVQ